ncbi:hypothetical protein MIND_00420500 [Mycena indigotica]|uniref:Uncharacterized protein n=1 Tax=Mycena indigotica TaxID=2126181 RepID=A0A8H6SYK9_9AGAR|nr:uncharacterized protein MIND_00420500 [Mycena indigotica]KAF7306295.1 hypothetical protein MIND_00420500 [Mycena indigotica]
MSSCLTTLWNSIAEFFALPPERPRTVYDCEINQLNTIDTNFRSEMLYWEQRLQMPGISPEVKVFGEQKCAKLKLYRLEIAKALVGTSPMKLYLIYLRRRAIYYILQS